MAAARKEPLTRSEMMARVRAKDTAPELAVRRALWASGLRYRLHDKGLPGRPDIVLSSRRVVVFVHGCFWHGHQGCPRHQTPKTRPEFWAEKIRRNRERDQAAVKALAESGWTVITAWACEIEKPERLATLANEIAALPRQRL